MTIDRRDGTTHRPQKPSSNEVKGGPRPTIPGEGNADKQKPFIPSQRPAPDQPYGH